MIQYTAMIKQFIPINIYNKTLLWLGVAMCWVVCTACSSTPAAHQAVGAKPFEAGSTGVQMYGEIDIGYGYSRSKISK